MNSLTTGLIAFASILAGTLLGFYLNKRLPEAHLAGDSKDAVKMAWSIVATMSALVLSLLLASAKSSFDTINNEIAQSGAQIIVLNHVLKEYGPEAKPVRVELREVVVEGLDRIWTGKMLDSASTALKKGSGVERVETQLMALKPTDDSQRALLAQARVLNGDLLLSRSLAIEQSRTALPNIFYLALVSWLTILFVGIGLFAPRNKTVLATLVLCNASFSIAIFLIGEMNHPLDGIIKPSSAPMREALAHLDASLD